MAAAAVGQDFTLTLLYMVLLVGAFYFMWFRPQQAARKKSVAMLASLALGDRIMTAGGILGTVRAFDGEMVDVEIAPGVIAKFTKRAVIERVVDLPMPSDD